MSCGVGPRRGLDPVWLWLWRRPAAAAPTGPLAWELPCAMSAVLKRPKKKPAKKVHTFNILIYPKKIIRYTWKDLFIKILITAYNLLYPQIRD